MLIILSARSIEDADAMKRFIEVTEGEVRVDILLSFSDCRTLSISIRFCLSGPRPFVPHTSVECQIFVALRPAFP